MLKSRKFWIPVFISILITIFASLYMVLVLMAAGAHAKSNSTGLGTLLFPYASLISGVSGWLGLIALLFAFLGQFPVYGALAGYGNFNDKIKPFLLGLFCVHLCVYFLASYFGNGAF